MDFPNSFSLVAKVVTVHFFLCGVANSWELRQLDINNAFFHGFLEEEVYMTPPQCYGKAKPGLVCKLKRSLYRLKQVSRQWNMKFTLQLQNYGFKQSYHEYCLFTYSKDYVFLDLLVYIDDVLITCNFDHAISEVKEFLDYQFTIKDLLHAKYYLGLHITRSANGLYVNPKNMLQISSKMQD